MKKVIALFLLAESLDFATTAIGMQRGFLELNPLVALFGWGPANLLKILGSIFIALALIVVYKYFPKLGITYGLFITLVAGYPVVNNFILLLEN